MCGLSSFKSVPRAFNAIVMLKGIHLLLFIFVFFQEFYVSVEFKRARKMNCLPAHTNETEDCCKEIK